MASSEHNGRRTPFKNISNTAKHGSGPTIPIVQPDEKDLKERKRQRARDVYANMPQDQKDMLLKKRREDDSLSSKEISSSTYK